MYGDVPWLLFSWRGRLDRMRFGTTLAIIWVALGLLYQILGLLAALFAGPLIKALLPLLFAAARPQSSFFWSPLFLTVASAQLFLLYVYGALCAKRLHDMGRSGAMLAVPAVIGGGAGAIIMLLFQAGRRSAEAAGWGVFFGGMTMFTVVAFAYAVMLLWLLTARSGEGVAPYYGLDEWPERSEMPDGRGPVQPSPAASPQLAASAGRAASGPTFGKRHVD